jgi:hypothetical protein
MKWQAMADKAKQVVQQRGGATAAKEDAQELRNIAQGQGSVADKAKQAAEAIREPGAPPPRLARRAVAGSRRCATADLTATPTYRRGSTVPMTCGKREVRLVCRLRDPRNRAR